MASDVIEKYIWTCSVFLGGSRSGLTENWDISVIGYRIYNVKNQFIVGRKERCALGFIK